jgi:DNA-binding response OmpR family regulator
MEFKRRAAPSPPAGTSIVSSASLQSAMMTTHAKRRRVLIVEDDTATRTGLEKLLQNAGYATVTASSLQDGLQAMSEMPPDLLIADVRLGEYNGIQLIATSGLSIPSIVITAFADPVLEAEARRFGADYLLKPVAPAQLMELIRRRLAEK